MIPPIDIFTCLQKIYFSCNIMQWQQSNAIFPWEAVPTYLIIEKL